MNFLALVALWAWVPIVLVLFAVRPAREAVLASFIFAWLFLPGIRFDLPGLPDWTKMTSTVTATMLGVLVFDAGRLLAFRPRWYDAPVLVSCVAPFFTSIVANQGPYDGLSAVLDALSSGGLPYLLGRLYFGDAEGMRRLCLGVVVGGLLYIPPCLVEMRLSPILRGLVYGIPRWEGTRYGGFRPAVFLSTGLELGMWMTFATLAAQRLWASGSVKALRGYPFGLLTLALAATAVLCRATGAIILLAVALAALYSVRLTGKTWVIWLLIAVGPAYCLLRVTGAWSGAEAVEVARSLVGEERAQSLEFRFECEKFHIAKAMQRPIWGYSRSGNFLDAKAANITERIIDGFWIIALGSGGLVSLATMFVNTLLPMILTIRRFPARTWSDPDVAPTVALALFLVIFMIDCLSNAMANPLYALAMGGVLGMKPHRRGVGRMGGEDSLALALELEAEGDRGGAEPAFRLAVEASADPVAAGVDPRDCHAEALAGLARALIGEGRHDEAAAALREALAVRLSLASGGHDPSRLRDLALGHETLARALGDAGHAREAIEERRLGLEIWSSLTVAHPRSAEYLGLRVDALNDLAWLLATDAEGPLRDPAAAVDLAAEAAREAPGNPSCWNTLGVARYRAGDWDGAVEALLHSVEIGPAGGTAFDHYFLAMACRHLGEVDRGRDWFDRAVAWSDRHRPRHPALLEFRAEAAAILSSPAIGSIGTEAI